MRACGSFRSRKRKRRTVIGRLRRSSDGLLALRRWNRRGRNSRRRTAGWRRRSAVARGATGRRGLYRGRCGRRKACASLVIFWGWGAAAPRLSPSVRLLGWPRRYKGRWRPRVAAFARWRGCPPGRPGRRLFVWLIPRRRRRLWRGFTTSWRLRRRTTSRRRASWRSGARRGHKSCLDCRPGEKKKKETI